MHSTRFQSYGERSESEELTPLATYLLRLAHLKRTNLCVSADVTSTSELLQLAEDVGEHICVLKTHADIINDFNEKTTRGLSEIARRKKFVVFEDRKFGDIGNTVQLQYTQGPLSIVRWAHVINCHIFPGPQIITALSQGAKKAITAYNTSVQTSISASPVGSVEGADAEEEEEEDDSDEDEDDEDDEDDDDEHESRSIVEPDPSLDDRKGRKHSVVSVSTTISTKTETISPQPVLRASLSRGSTESEDEDEIDEEERKSALEDLGPPPFYRSLLLLAQMSSADNFFTPQYTAACLKHARQNRDFVMGFIAQEALNKEPGDNFITMTPGVQKAAGGDGMGQQYNTPRKVIIEAGADIIIVGRGILNAPNRRAEALEYRKQGWLAYEERLRNGRKKK